jgi:gliding motility-associated-like protein
MKYLITAFIGLTFSIANAQTNWLQGAGGNANDEALDMIQDASGNIYSCGYFNNTARFDNFTISSNGLSDIFISKQDPLGNYLWVKSAGGALDDRATGITISTSGEIFITGIIRGTASFGSSSISSIAGSQDICIAKLSPSGNFIWAQSYGGADTDLATDIAADGGGNLIVTGQFKGTSSFGPYTFTSMSYPASMPGSGGMPSYDALIFKTQASGTVLWAKQGTAPYDDRILRVVTNSASDIFVCGQFSDTLSFSSTYPNNAFNAGLLMKMDSDGIEIWLRRILSPQLMIYDMKLQGANILLAGDYRGTLTYKGTPNNYLSGSSNNKIFIIKAEQVNGDYITSTQEHSDNQLSLRSIATDPANNIYIAGTFKCSFSTMAALYGNGLFSSVGYKDVFVIKYNSTLTRQWGKHYGGLGDDQIAAVSANNVNSPVISGSYSKNFNIPEAGNFQSHVNNINTQNSNLGSTICGNNQYGKFITQKDWGSKDILVAKPVDLTCPLYDYFQRINNTCALDTLMPSRFPSGDTLIACDMIQLNVTTPTTVDSAQAPEWSYQWSNGSTMASTTINSTGWHYITYGYADNCREFVDSFYVQIYASPAAPTITVINGNMMEAIPMGSCLQKAVADPGDSVLFIASGILPGYQMHWIAPNGSTFYNDSIYALDSGNYQIIIESPGGLCQYGFCVALNYWGTPGTCSNLTTLTPQIVFADSTFNVTDTVTICKNDHFEMQLVDSALFVNGIPTYINTFAEWAISGGFAFDPYVSFHTTFMSHKQEFKALSSGICTVTVDILNPSNSSPYLTLARTFYLDVREAPANNPSVSGPLFFCPGDTVTLIASGGANYSWSGPGIISTSPSGNSVLAGMTGEYSVFSQTIDSLLGCSDSTTVQFILNMIPAPTVQMLPSSGVICPMDSVLLTGDNGSNYIWYGPGGTAIASTQSIWVSTPGFYYYSYTSATGCNITSATCEVSEYSTPYLEGLPGTSLCSSGTVLIGVDCDPGANITWSSPLSGSAPTQLVNAAGTYNVSVTSCGITTSANITITNSGQSPVQILYSGPDTICSQDTLMLQADAGFDSYTWFPDESSSQFHVGVGGGFYYLEATDVHGCISGDTITVYSFPEVVAPASFDTTVCANSIITLISTPMNGSNTYWYNNLNGGTVLHIGDTLQFQAQENDSAIFVSHYDGTCFSERSIFNIFIQDGSQTPSIQSSAVYCAGDTIVLSPVTILDGVEYHWSANNIDADTSTLYIYPASALNNDTYILTASSGSCTPASDSLTIVVSEIDLQDMTATLSACQNDSLVLLSDTLQGTYLWNNTIAGNQLQVTNSGQYYYTYTSPEGCVVSSDTTSVTIFGAPAAPLGTDTTVCPGSPVTLNAYSSGNTIEWYNANGTLIHTGASLSLPSVSTSTIYFSVAIDVNGCSSDTSASDITISAPLPSPLLSTDDTLCITDTIQLFASSVSGYTYHWSGPAGFTDSVIAPQIFPLSSANAGVYSLYISQGYCISETASVSVVVESGPAIIVTNNPSICIGDSVQITAGGNISSFVWNNGSTSSSITVSPSVTTLYWITGTNSCGSATQNIQVEVNQLPTVTCTGNTTHFVGESSQIVLSGGVAYSWFPSTGLSCTSCADPVMSLSSDQVYHVTVTDSNGCSQSDSILIQVEDVCTAYIPNSFTPNGDGTNDQFSVQGRNIIAVDMEIYNRWGKLVYKNTNMNEGWDGKNPQQNDNSAAFVYLINVKWSNGESKDFKGTVSVIK